MRLLHCSAGLALLALVLAGCETATSTCDPSAAPGTCQTLQCTGSLRDCKNGAADGCETDTARDTENCGACGNRCATPANGEAVCTDGVCGVATCGTRYKDCNTRATDGCEVDTFRDVNNCGACGNVCKGGTNASAVCIAGTCKLACQAAYLDCNGDATDGCETNGASDNNNCGNCGNLCTAMGATNAACAAGSCISTMCTGTFQTCKAGPITSCETDTATSVNNCGVCGKQCGALANATPGCAASNCGIGSCNTGYGDCDNAFANGCETNTTNSVNNCSACGKACPALANASINCVASTCGLNACNAGYGNCDNTIANGCETSLTSDALNCGLCGKVCGALANATPGCAASACGIGSCNTGYGNCDNAAANGCETNTTTSAAHCGACGNNCGALPNAVAGCTASTCSIASCNTGFDDCDKVATNGCEVNINSDINNCGTCGKACGAGLYCAAGVCTILPPSCQIVNGVRWCYDPNNCGQACNQVCSSIGLPFTIDDTTWFNAQNTTAKCQAISMAFGLGSTISMANYTYACAEDESGTHSVPGGLGGPLLCSTYSGCPSEHRTKMDALGTACGPNSRRSLCPCQ